jgi:hypothetical protein
MYGTEAESTTQPSNATVTVNDIVVTIISIEYLFPKEEILKWSCF